jgi:hypothetical protein
VTVVLIVIAAFVAFALWMVWEYRHSPEGYETEHGYGPVSYPPRHPAKSEFVEWDIFEEERAR